LTTNKPLNIAFPGKIKGFFLGEQSAHVTNSMIEETEVFVNFDNFMMSSLAHDVSKCEFLKEGCIVDGLTFVWEAKCWEGKPCAPCSYVPSTTVEGIFGNKLFISNDHEIALSFQKKVVFDKLPRARACNGAELIISEQGMGVSREDLMPLFAPAAPKRKRREAATTEELAVELTALEASLLSTIARIHNRMCRQIKPDVGNPTKVARRLSKRGDLMARWASANVLQVFPCAKLDKSAVVPRKAASCYQYLPVQVDVPDIGRVDAFLDLELGIVSATSSEADCRMFRYHFLRGKTGMLKFDVLTGELEKVGAEMVHQIVPGDQVEEWNVTMEAFHDLVLSNESDVFSEIFHAQHVEELRREDHWKDQDEVISTSKSRALSATPHTLPGVVRAYFFGYFHVAHEVWINVCAGITTVVTLSIVVVFCLPAGLVNIVLAGGRALMKIPRAVRTLVPAKAQREAPRDRVIEEAVGQREATGLRPPPKPPRLLTLPRWPSVGRNEPGESTSAAPATLDVTWQNPATERMERIIEAHIPSRVRFQRAGGAGTEDTAEIEVAEGPSASAGWTPARLGEKWKNIFQT
jgi:hypothetical protein